jgi:hypothetical protein
MKRPLKRNTGGQFLLQQRHGSTDSCPCKFLNIRRNIKICWFYGHRYTGYNLSTISCYISIPAEEEDRLEG